MGSPAARMFTAPMSATSRGFLRGSGIAYYFGVSRSTVTRWRQGGWITGYRIGRTILYDLAEVIAVVKGNPMRPSKRRPIGS